MGAKPPEAERVLFFARPMEVANLLYSLYCALSANMYREIEGCDVNVSKSKYRVRKPRNQEHCGQNRSGPQDLYRQIRQTVQSHKHLK